MTDASEEQPPYPEQVRHAVIRAFEQAYDDAGLRGLCPEGRYEAAINAARKLDLDRLQVNPAPGQPSPPSPGQHATK